MILKGTALCSVEQPAVLYAAVSLLSLLVCDFKINSNPELLEATDHLNEK